MGVQFRKNDFEGTIKSVYYLILKKLNVSPKRPKKSVEKKEIVDFRSAQVSQLEADILQEIEVLTNKQFTKVNEVKYDTKMGFSTENQRIIGIGLYKCDISTLPESISDLKSLQRLYLSDNKFTTLPESITKLESLQTLNLSWNKLSTLPESIGNLKSLQILGLSGNKLSTLPESITKIESLQILGLNGNKLSTLPESITKIESLQILDLGSNKLSTLPESINNLKSLKELWLGDNDLTTLPESIKTLEKRGVAIYK